MVAIGSVGLVVVIALATLFGVFRDEAALKLERRLGGYRQDSASASPDSRGSVNPKESAVALAQKVISSGGREAKLAKKLDAAGLSLQPAEWVLLHTAISIGAAFIGFLLSGGSVPLALLLMLVGIVLPWVYLTIKHSRRLRAFNSQLGETLQLVSGALSAGLSLPQAIDTIMRDGVEPMSGEFRRALVEARLGVDIEDALDGVAERMSSKDFEWVVMAVRIQRQVGGNLSELLLTVSTTLREREFLRRQVRSLSAEGRLSAYILCGLPPLFIVYLYVTRRDYIMPLFQTGLGWAMVALATVLMTTGAFWMSRVVKVEV
jgi:tight adherence protein B